ncbi:putative replication termination factor 2 [[Candida] railenensis]|uniref:Replication termination factor 2 n=1 Tax=[Candida] railenensis TaxID=45579 RepID=A0A9P0W1R8_9ASCO|nr:putative replication termination factor 2 [[Candida] railenensis]
MGNDGGSIAKRQDILSFHKHQAGSQKSSDIVQDDNVIVCSVSSLPLRNEIVVGDYLGRLYIKEKIVEYMLNRNLKSENGADATLPSTLSDILELKLHWQDDKTIVCPVTGGIDLCYLRPCGCVVSYKLLQELHKGDKRNDQSSSKMELSSSTCPNCEIPFTFDYDVVLIDQAEKAADFNKKTYEYLATQLKLHHSKKPIKEKKKKRKQEDDSDGVLKEKKNKKKKKKSS